MGKQSCDPKQPPTVRVRPFLKRFRNDLSLLPSGSTFTLGYIKFLTPHYQIFEDRKVAIYVFGWGFSWTLYIRNALLHLRKKI